MKLCRCKHDEARHGSKFILYADPPQTVYKGCLVSNCVCIQFVEVAEENSATMNAALGKKIRDFERDLRQMQLRLQELKQQAR